MARTDRLRVERDALRRDADAIRKALVDVEQQIKISERTCADLRTRIQHTVRQAIMDGERFDFSTVDEQVADLFDRLRDREQSLNDVLNGAENAARDADQHWHSAAAQLATEEEALDQCEETIDKLAAERDDVKQLIVREREIELFAQRLAQRHQPAVDEAKAKRAVYERDRFFRYLQKRHGEAGLTSRFDRWLAEACHFSENRRHYQLLVELPQRLATAKQEAERQQIDLKIEIMKARRGIGQQFNSAALQARVNEAQQAVDAARTARDRERARVEAARAEMERIEGGEHTLHQDIDATINHALSHQSLAEFVRATLSQEDDAWLGQHQQLVRKIDGLQRERNDLRRRRQDYEIEIDDTERRIKRHRRRGHDDLGGIAAAVITGALLSQLGRIADGDGPSRGSSGGGDGGFGGGDFDSGDSF